MVFVNRLASYSLQMHQRLQSSSVPLQLLRVTMLHFTIMLLETQCPISHGLDHTQVQFYHTATYYSWKL